MITFEKIDLKKMNWALAESMGELNVFQTQAWLSLLNEKQGVEPVIAAIKEDGHLLGYYYGLLVEKYGLRILGSPFRGWTTYFMGFNLKPGTSRQLVLKAFPDFAFNDLHCHYTELVDPCIRDEDCCGLDYKVEKLPWFMLNLSLSEEELFRNMKHACRTNIRKAYKNRITIEAACAPSFADDYYAQYSDVMQRHSLKPGFKYENVTQLIEHLLPTGNLLMLRAKSQEGVCIATGLFLALNQTAVFWGAASWHEFQNLRPNEYLAWEGIKLLKARGIRELHFGGYAAQFKEKFGCCDAHIIRLKLSNSSVLGWLIDIAASPTNEHYRNWILRKL